MMSAFKNNTQIKAVIFSNCAKGVFEQEYQRKLARYDLEILQVISPDRSKLVQPPEGATHLICLNQQMNDNQLGVAKVWAKNNGLAWVSLPRASSDWPRLLGMQPSLVAVPAPPPSTKAPVVVEKAEMPVPPAPPPAPSPVDAELATLYAKENEELRTEVRRLTELSQGYVPPEKHRQILDSLRSNAALLAGKTRKIEKLEKELEALRLRPVGGDGNELRKKVAELEKELGQKRQTMVAWEEKMKSLLKEKEELEGKLARAVSARTTSPATVEKIVYRAPEGLSKALTALLSMVDAGLMTSDEAFKKLATKYGD